VQRPRQRRKLIARREHDDKSLISEIFFAFKTVGTLLSRSYEHGPALIGAIFGTGTNGAYIDRVETIEKLGEKAIAEAKKGGPTAGEFMVINTEWGAIDNGVSGKCIRGQDTC
jgi:hexokinase